MSDDEQQTPDFEKSLAELETLVARMEAGELTLEESLRCYERGVELSRACQHALDRAEQRVRVLTERAEGAVLEPLADADKAGRE